MIKSKKTLENVKPYEIDRYYTDFPYKLDSNENPYGASPAVIDAIKNFDSSKIKYYPAYGALLDALAGHFFSSPDNFLLTNGCDEAISAVLNTYLEPDDEILSFCPTFSMPVLYSDCIGAKFVEIPYKKHFEFDVELYKKHVTKNTKIIYLTSPNNPTGELILPDAVEELLEHFKDKLVVLDCTYLNYSSLPKEKYYDFVKRFDNLVIVKSFSKDYALAGLRLGYIYSDRVNINEIKKTLSPYSVNGAAVCAGIAALNDAKHFDEIKEKITQSKQKLKESILNAGYTAYNTEANFILADFGCKRDFIYNKFLNNGIKVKYFKTGSVLDGFFRITAPKLEDVNKISSVIQKRALFVFDLDGVLFDVRNSYRLAIKKTVEHFTKKIITDGEIQEVKNLGNKSNDWDVCAYLIKNAGINVEYNEIVDIFQNYFYIKEKGGFIDNEELVLNGDFFETISKYADCAVFTGRPKEEAFYSLEKFKLKKYFSYFVCNEDVQGNYKPSPYGLNIIKKNCAYKDIFYFGDTVDDIKAGIDARVQTYGVIPPNSSFADKTKEKMLACGAYGVFDKAGDISKLTLGEKLCAK